ncbi:MAG: gliding motility-associated C-terminal domain-containing protein [Saprospiraceae bacterium]|nr:gliding motility-associated C-terminal domain-containing protein [Saprospiraceae bacterium]
MNKFFRILFIINISLTSLWAQPSNDNCNNPVIIGDVTKFCSKTGEYTNVASTPSGYGSATCWPGTGSDVWFRFRAFFTDVSITIIGTNKGGSPAGTLTRPMVALYKGICGGTISELECGVDGQSNGIVNIYQGGLVVGADYFIRVDGVGNATGTFQLCINNFNPPAKAEQDCPASTVLCDKSPFVVQNLTGSGLFADEAFDSCLGDNNATNSESSSVWYSWVAANDGTLTFTLNPLNPSDDIDFALYELPSGIHNCSDKQVLRCNATAPPCAGPTGLNFTDQDITEDLNCNSGENGYCKFIDMQQGKAYTLVINNFTNTGIGFSIDWGGTGEFLGPVANFGIEPPTGLKCETDFMVIDSSSINQGSILRWTWNFGTDAIPLTANGRGPHFVRYNSVGEKYITLTIETSTGCKVTDIRRLVAEPCCEDFPTLNIRIDSMRDVRCFGENNGMIAISGEQGSPFSEVIGGIPTTFYNYSLNGQEFSSTNRFTNLSAGIHTIIVQDRKGCLDTIEIEIKEPPPVVPNAGSEIEIELGDYLDLNASVIPGGFYNYFWYRGDSIECNTCQNSQALPFNTGYYAIQATNDNGCFGVDSFLVRVRKNYEIYPPNVFSPNGDNINDVFFTGGSKSLVNIDEMSIFDRWGNLVFRGTNLIPRNPNSGWNGRSGDQNCLPGVYVYQIKGKFLDGFVKTVSGDLTLLR